MRYPMLCSGLAPSALILLTGVSASCAASTNRSAAFDRSDLAGVYEWEVPTEGTSGILVIQTNESWLQLSDGEIIECDQPLRPGDLSCDLFHFDVIDGELHGEYVPCRETLVRTTEVHGRDPETGELVTEVNMKPRRTCDMPVPMTVTRAGAGS